ncbi:MAG: O-antigen ligase family protein [Bacteroidota bacterium]
MQSILQNLLDKWKAGALLPKVFLFLFVLIPFLPRFGALDAMGFHWMCYAILNIFISFYLINVNALYRLPFTFKPILFYSIWIGLSMASCFFAYNTIESIVVLSRMLIVLVGIYNLYCLIKKEEHLLSLLLGLFVTALTIESVYTIWMLYYNFERYNAVDDIIYFIRFYAGNKNILAASIAVKIPILFYFIHRNNNRKLSGLLYLLLILALSATIILNARATYISVFLQSLLFLAYEIYHFIKLGKNKIYLQKAASFFALWVVVIIIWQALFSQIEKAKKTVSYGDINKRIASIEFSKSGSSSRFVYWNEAIDFIKKHPLTGGGLGNWKIHAINYEQTYRTSFVCSKHVHNDFLEVAADSGVLAAIVFTLFFIALLFVLFKNSLQVDSTNSTLAFLLLLMLIGFLIDSCLNFPSERPIMQSLLVVIMALSCIYINQSETKSLSINHPFAFILLTSLCFSMYISINAYYSMCLQAKVRGNTAKISEVKSFPAIPNISEYVMPINGMQANYFYSKKDYQRALEYLNQKGNTNPYYYYKEYITSRILFAKHDTLQALHFARIAFENRPADIGMFSNLIWMYQSKKDTAAINKAYQTIRKYIKDPKAEDVYANYYLKSSGDTAFIKQFINAKIVEFPLDTLLKKRLKTFN